MLLHEVGLALTRPRAADPPAGGHDRLFTTWMICTSTKRKPCAVPREPRPAQLGTVLARSRPSRAPAARWPRAASLDLRCARRRGEASSGPRNGARSNKETGLELPETNRYGPSRSVTSRLPIGG